MKKCQNCNSEIISDSKFCSNCGHKLLNNEKNYIDNSIDFITNQIKESKYVNKAVNNSYEITSEMNKTIIENSPSNETINIFFKRIIAFIGVLSAIYIVSQLLFDWTDYRKTDLYNNWNYCTTRIGIIGFINDFSCFIGRSIFTIIIPFLSILITSRIYKISLLYFIILLVLYLFTF